MGLPIEFHAEAPGELRAAYERYDGLRSDLADDFASSVDRAFEAIIDNPLG